MPEQTFTDAEITAACGLHVDNLRKLITWGAVRPVQAGGGRGRVRLWTMKQAMRIAITAQFVDAGFSLQMANTLTYCLPFDDMLQLFDPSFIIDKLNPDDPLERWLKSLISPKATDYWPPSGTVGEGFYIIDGRAVYADLLGDNGTLFGVIDLEMNRYLPHWPIAPLWGVVSEAIGKPPLFGISEINRSFLLVDKELLPPQSGEPLSSDQKKRRAELDEARVRMDRLEVELANLKNRGNRIDLNLKHKEDQRKLGINEPTLIPEYPTQIDYPDCLDDVFTYRFRKILNINFAASLAIGFRKLLHLPLTI